MSVSTQEPASASIRSHSAGDTLRGLAQLSQQSLFVATASARPQGARNKARMEPSHRDFGMGDLHVPEGTRMYLSTEPTEGAVAPTMIVHTNNLEEYKVWVGRPDSDMMAVDIPWELPSRPWNLRPLAHVDELTQEERADLEKASAVYIFGNSQLVADYRKVIEVCYAPFSAAIYVARKVTIGAGASLVVTGMPALLRFSELEIHPEGRLITYAVCNATIDRLHKL